MVSSHILNFLLLGNTVHSEHAVHTCSCVLLRPQQLSMVSQPRPNIDVDAAVAVLGNWFFR